MIRDHYIFIVTITDRPEFYFLSADLPGQNLTSGYFYGFIAFCFHIQIIFRIRLFFRWLQAVLHRWCRQFDGFGLTAAVGLQLFQRLPGGSGVADTDFRSLDRPILDLRDKLDLQLAAVGIGLHRFYKRG